MGAINRKPFLDFLSLAVADGRRLFCYHSQEANLQPTPNYFCDKSHLLLGRLSVKAELEPGSDKPGFYAVLCIPVDMPVLNGGDSDSLAVMA